jgi:hypothetical protein
MSTVSRRGSSSFDLVFVFAFTQVATLLADDPTSTPRGDLANNVPAERGVAAEQSLEGMQPLLALSAEIVLLTHGAPADRAALGRALAMSPS